MFLCLHRFAELLEGSTTVLGGSKGGLNSAAAFLADLKVTARSKLGIKQSAFFSSKARESLSYLQHSCAWHFPASYALGDCSRTAKMQVKSQPCAITSTSDCPIGHEHVAKHGCLLAGSTGGREEARHQEGGLMLF